MKQTDWPGSWARHVGENVAQLRGALGWSAQSLSDRTEALGHRVTRNSIANLENGRKGEVPVHEVAVLAAALGVPPTRLLFLPSAANVSLLPEITKSGWSATLWFTGLAELAFPDDYQAGVTSADAVEFTIVQDAEYNLIEELHSLRRVHARAIEEFSDAKAAYEDARAGLAPPVPRGDERSAWGLDDWEGAMETARRRAFRLTAQIGQTYEEVERCGLQLPPELQPDVPPDHFAQEVAADLHFSQQDDIERGK